MVAGTEVKMLLSLATWCWVLTSVRCQAPINISQFQDHIVRIHNGYRSVVAADATNMNKLSWDDNLAKEADLVSRNCYVGPNQIRYGENTFYMETPALQDKELITKAVDMWYSEGAAWQKTTVCTDACKYTQLIWATTRKIGCSAFRCLKLKLIEEFLADVWFIACLYDPKGNQQGELPYEAGPPCTKCPITSNGNSTCEKDLCVEPPPPPPPTTTPASPWKQRRGRQNRNQYFNRNQYKERNRQQGWGRGQQNRRGQFRGETNQSYQNTMTTEMTSYMEYTSTTPPLNYKTSPKAKYRRTRMARRRQGIPVYDPQLDKLLPPDQWGFKDNSRRQRGRGGGRSRTGVGRPFSRPGANVAPEQPPGYERLGISREGQGRDPYPTTTDYSIFDKRTTPGPDNMWSMSNGEGVGPGRQGPRGNIQKIVREPQKIKKLIISTEPKFSMNTGRMVEENIIFSIHGKRTPSNTNDSLSNDQPSAANQSEAAKLPSGLSISSKELSNLTDTAVETTTKSDREKVTTTTQKPVVETRAPNPMGGRGRVFRRVITINADSVTTSSPPISSVSEPSNWGPNEFGPTTARPFGYTTSMQDARRYNRGRANQMKDGRRGRGRDGPNPDRQRYRNQGNRNGGRRGNRQFQRDLYNYDTPTTPAMNFVSDPYVKKSEGRRFSQQNPREQSLQDKPGGPKRGRRQWQNKSDGYRYQNQRGKNADNYYPEVTSPFTTPGYDRYQRQRRFTTPAPPPKTTTEIYDPSCQDSDSNCKEWQVYCADNVYVFENCRRTCGSCNTPTPPTKKTTKNPGRSMNGPPAQTVTPNPTMPYQGPYTAGPYYGPTNYGPYPMTTMPPTAGGMNQGANVQNQGPGYDPNVAPQTGTAPGGPAPWNSGPDTSAGQYPQGEPGPAWPNNNQGPGNPNLNQGPQAPPSGQDMTQMAQSQTVHYDPNVNSIQPNVYTGSLQSPEAGNSQGMGPNPNTIPQQTSYQGPTESPQTSGQYNYPTDPQMGPAYANPSGQFSPSNNQAAVSGGPMQTSNVQTMSNTVMAANVNQPMTQPVYNQAPGGQPYSGGPPGTGPYPAEPAPLPQQQQQPQMLGPAVDPYAQQQQTGGGGGGGRGGGPYPQQPSSNVYPVTAAPQTSRFIDTPPLGRANFGGQTDPAAQNVGSNPATNTYTTPSPYQSPGAGPYAPSSSGTDPYAGQPTSAPSDPYGTNPGPGPSAFGGGPDPYSVGGAQSYDPGPSSRQGGDPYMTGSNTAPVDPYPNQPVTRMPNAYAAADPYYQGSSPNNPYSMPTTRAPAPQSGGGTCVDYDVDCVHWGQYCGYNDHVDTNCLYTCGYCMP